MDYVIGIGGTGGFAQKVLKYNSSMFRSGAEQSIKHLYIDALTFNLVNESLAEDDRGGFSPINEVDIAQNEYIGFVGESFYPLAQALAKNEPLPERDRYSWFCAKEFIDDLRVPPRVFNLTEGAGQYRQFGRLGVGKNIDKIWQTLDSMIRSEPVGVPVNFYLCCSLVGGTGSGAFLDVGAIIRHLGLKHNRNVQVFLVLALESAFLDLSGTDEFKHSPERAFAVLRELHRVQLAPSPTLPLVIKYAGRVGTASEIVSHVFDGVYLADVPILDSGGRATREQHLFPAMADLIEIFTEPNAAQQIAQSTVNLNRLVNKYQNHVATADAEYQEVGISAEMLRGLPKHEPAFSAFAIHRIIYPKRLYLEKFAYRIARRFVEELFQPVPGGGGLRDDLRPDRVLSPAEAERVQQEESWALLHEVGGSENTLLTGFPLERLLVDSTQVTSTEYEEVNTAFNTQTASELLKQLTPNDELARTQKDLIEANLSRLSGLCTGNPNERQVLTTRVKETKTRFYGDELEPSTTASGLIHDRLKDYGERLLRSFAELCAEEIQRELGGATGRDKRGRLGALMRRLDIASEDYLGGFLRKLQARGDQAREDWNARNAEAQRLLREASSQTRGWFGARLKTAQQTYLRSEEELLESTKRYVANAYMLRTVSECQRIVKHWYDECRRWSLEAAVTTGANSYERLADEISRVDSELIWLQQNPNISIGIEDDADEDHPSMGGYEDYLFERLDSERQVIGPWLDSALWEVVDGGRPDRPGRLVLRLFSSRDEVTRGDLLHEPLREKAKDYCESQLGGTDIFDYLLEFLPNRHPSPISIDAAVEKISAVFDSKDFLIKTSEAPPFIYGWLFYRSGGTTEERRLVDGIMARMPSIGRRLAAPQLLSNYESDSVFGYIRMGHGITLGTCETTTRYRDSYLKSVNENDWMLSIYHIFDEEQTSTWAERTLYSSESLTARDLIPSQVRAALQSKERVDLFLKLLAVRAIRNVDGKLHLLTAGPPGGDGPAEGFVLANSTAFFEAMATFVNRGKNKSSRTRVQELPAIGRLHELLTDAFLSEAAQESGRSKSQELLAAMTDLCDRLEKVEPEAGEYVVRDKYPQLSIEFKKLLTLWARGLRDELEKQQGGFWGGDLG